MQKKFIFNLIFLIGLNLLIKPFWILGIDVGVQNAVGANHYGFYFTLLNFTFLFNILLDMGTSNFNNRNIARNEQLLDKHFSKIITLKFLLGIFYTLSTLLIALIIGYDKFQFKLLYFLIFNQFLNSFILYLRSNISALLMFKTDSILSITDRFLMILFCSILLWSSWVKKPFQIEWFVYAQTLAYSLTAIIAFIIVAKKSHFLKLDFDFPFMLMILKKSLPFALLTLLMSLYNKIDSVMIERMLPDNISSYQVGIYASSYRLLDALVMISYLCSVLLLPIFAKMHKQKMNIQPIVSTSFNLLIFFSLTSVVCLTIYAKDILSMLYHEHINESVSVFLYLIPAIIPISLSYIFGTLLTAAGNMKALNIIAATGILINIILNFILIPHLGAKGSAITSLITQSAVSICQIIAAFRILKLNLKILRLGHLFIFGILLLLTTYIIHFYLPISWFYQLFIIGCCACLFLFLSKMVRLSDIKKLIDIH